MFSQALTMISVVGCAEIFLVTRAVYLLLAVLWLMSDDPVGERGGFAFCTEQAQTDTVKGIHTKTLRTTLQQ